jgi:hypothetical protein
MGEGKSEGTLRTSRSSIGQEQIDGPASTADDFNPSVNSRGGRKSKRRVWCRLHKTRSHPSLFSCTQSSTPQCAFGKEPQAPFRRFIEEDTTLRDVDCRLRTR